MSFQLEKTIIVTGHYGSGKTTLAINLAMHYSKMGEQVALADLDVVNPYFRSSDFREIAEKNGIKLIASAYAGSSLDIPALTAELDGALGKDMRLIIDVGGDDQGATALGRYSQRITNLPYSMLYVISAYRYLVKQPQQSIELLKEIETAARINATGIANCSSLGLETTAQDVRNSLDYAKRVAELSDLPIVLTGASKDIAGELSDIQDLFEVELYVKAPWNS